MNNTGLEIICFTAQIIKLQKAGNLDIVISNDDNHIRHTGFYIYLTALFERSESGKTVIFLTKPSPDFLGKMPYFAVIGNIPDKDLAAMLRHSGVTLEDFIKFTAKHSKK